MTDTAVLAALRDEFAALAAKCELYHAHVFPISPDSLCRVMQPGIPAAVTELALLTCPVRECKVIEARVDPANYSVFMATGDANLAKSALAEFRVLASRAQQKLNLPPRTKWPRIHMPELILQEITPRDPSGQLDINDPATYELSGLRTVFIEPGGDSRWVDFLYEMLEPRTAGVPDYAALALPFSVFMVSKQAVEICAKPRAVVQLRGVGQPPIVSGQEVEKLTPARYKVVAALVNAGPNGLTKDALEKVNSHAREYLRQLRTSSPLWEEAIIMAGQAWQGYSIRHE